MILAARAPGRPYLIAGEVSCRTMANALSDDDGARFRERLLVSRPIEELRRAHRYPGCEAAAKRRTRKGYINFIADFFRANKSATRAQAIAAWTELKELDIRKDYASWIKARSKRQGKSR